MKLKIIFLLFLFNKIYSQDFIKIDTIKNEGKIYKTYHISFGSSSSPKLFKVITCGTSNLEKVAKEIITYHQNRKLEFTEFYLIAIPNYEKIKPEKEKKRRC